MKITCSLVLHAAALGCVAALASSAALAAGTTADQNTAAASGTPSNVGEPSAATPSVGNGSATRAGVTGNATQTFVMQATYASDAEIAAARYALTHSRSTDVQRFARRMIADHTKANRELLQIASSQGLTTPSGLSDEDRVALMRLERDHGAAFDAAYAQAQARDQGDVLAMFKRAEQNPQIDQAERDLADRRLPVLQDHLQLANQLVASHEQGNHSAG